MKLTGSFPVLYALETIGDIIKGTYYVVLPDNHFNKNTPAQCYKDEDGNFKIEIEQYIYDGAYKRHIGAYLDIICHEICHVFLFKFGYTPIIERSFDNYELSSYESVEWQAKALCGELMIPYDESKHMSENEIMHKYHVSKDQAYYRINNIK